jgi:hypothetical protein
MTMKYRASARGFFDSDLHRTIPEDAVTVPARRYAALLAGQAEGHEIVADARGRPQLRSLQPQTVEAAMAACVHAIRQEAARRIDQRFPVWKQLNALRENRDPGFHEIDAIRAASNLIEGQMRELTDPAKVAAFPVIDNPLWPVFETGEQSNA